MRIVEVIAGYVMLAAAVGFVLALVNPRWAAFGNPNAKRFKTAMYYIAALVAAPVIGGLIGGITSAPPTQAVAVSSQPSAVQAPAQRPVARDPTGNELLVSCAQAPTTLDRHDCFSGLERRLLTLDGVVADVATEDTARVDVGAGMAAHVYFGDSIRDWISRGSRIRFTGTVMAAGNSSVRVAAAHIDEILPHDVNSLFDELKANRIRFEMLYVGAVLTARGPVTELKDSSETGRTRITFGRGVTEYLHCSVNASDLASWPLHQTVTVRGKLVRLAAPFSQMVLSPCTVMGSARAG